MLPAFLSSIFNRLDLLKNIPPAIDDIVAQKQNLLSAINGKQVRAFFAPFGISEIVTTITGLLTDCETVRNCEDEELGRLVEETISKIYTYTNDDEQSYSLLRSRFVEPFYHTVETALKHLLNSSRVRFDCSIKPVLFNNRLEKKYPIAEPERNFILSIPMQNTGPGTAFDVRVELSEPDHLCLYNREMYLGDLRPGTFSLSIDCLTIGPANGRALGLHIVAPCL